MVHEKQNNVRPSATYSSMNRLLELCLHTRFFFVRVN